MNYCLILEKQEVELLVRALSLEEFVINLLMSHFAELIKSEAIETHQTLFIHRCTFIYENKPEIFVAILAL